MTQKLAHGGFAGVPQSVFDDYDYDPFFEELAASLPEKPCPKCGGTGWVYRCIDWSPGLLVTCDCQREEANSD